MAYTSSFLDNQVIGVDALNGIAKMFVGAGVEQEDIFSEGTPYNVSVFNGISALVVGNGNSGAVPNGITTLQVTRGAGDTVNIDTGTAFFANGSTLTVTSSHNLAFTAGEVNYVYLQSSTPINQNYPACTTTAPTGDFVMLAEIDASGNITDKRVYARGKVPSYASNGNIPLVTSLEFEEYQSATVTKTIELGANNRYNWFLVDFKPYTNYGSCLALWRLDNSTISYTRPSGGGGYTDVRDEAFNGTIFVYNRQFTFAVSNGILSVAVQNDLSYPFYLTIYAF